MCEETGKAGRELENKWIYVLVLFVTITCWWFRPDAQLLKAGLHLLIFLKICPQLLLQSTLIARSAPEVNQKKTLDAACGAQSRRVSACQTNVSCYVWRIDLQWAHEHVVRQDTRSYSDQDVKKKAVGLHEDCSHFKMLIVTCFMY